MLSKWKSSVVVYVTKNLLQSSFYGSICIQAIVQLWEKNYECTECKPSKWVKSAEFLEKHRKQYHTGEIPLLKCAYANCDQTCGNAGSLKKHINWHKYIEKKRKRRGRTFKKTKATQ